MASDFQISTLDMLAVNPALAVTEGLAYDAPYLYVTPHDDYVIAKIDTRTGTIVDTLDLSQFDLGLVAMLGSFIVDGYLYILPHLTDTGPVYQSNVVQVDLGNFTPSGCAVLKVLDASQSLTGLDGRTDGINGYLNVQVSGQAVVTRFGLGANFNAASITTVAIPTIQGFPVSLSSLVAVDETTVWSFAMLTTSPGTGNGDWQNDLWLVAIPIANFTAEAATFQRLTDVGYLRAGIPIAVDDGKTLWCPPIPISTGPLAGQFVGVIEIPKADPAAAAIYQGPPAQPYPTAASVSGVPVYDGWRYGYVVANSAAQILQIDTQNPGTVNGIDIAAYSAGYAMWGLGYDGHLAYAVSYNGGAGLCLSFLPTQPPAGDSGTPA